jgi:hypothetical protein
MSVNISSFYVDLPLSGVATRFNHATNFIASRVFPMVPTDKQTGFFYNLDPNVDSARLRNTLRAPGNEPNIFTYQSPTETSYRCEPYFLQGIVPDELKQADAETLAALPTLELLTFNIKLAREKELVDLIAAAATATTIGTTSPSPKWDASSGDFVTNVLATFETFRQSRGVTPNAIAMSALVAEKIVNSASFRDRFKFDYNANNGIVLNGFGRQQFAGVIASVLGIPESNVLISDAYYNAAAEGATASMTSIWGENVLLFHVSPVRGVSTQNFGIHPYYSPSNLPGLPSNIGKSLEFLVGSERRELRFSDVYFAGCYYDQIITNAGAGYLFTDVLT